MLVVDSVKVDSSQGDKLLRISGRGNLTFSIESTNLVEGSPMSGTPAGQEPLTYWGVTPSTSYGPLLHGTAADKVSKANLTTQATIY